LSIRKAREFRKTMTPPERRLWNALKARPEGLKFRKQHEHGPYYLDFFCHEAAVAVEVDGLAHELAVTRSATSDETRGSPAVGSRRSESRRRT
jgi:very-short-patch-repair endonuclease